MGCGEQGCGLCWGTCSIMCMGGGVLGQKSKMELWDSIVVALLEQAVGGKGGGVLVVRGELMVVVKVAIQ